MHLCFVIGAYAIPISTSSIPGLAAGSGVAIVVGVPPEMLPTWIACDGPDVKSLVNCAYDWLLLAICGPYCGYGSKQRNPGSVVSRVRPLPLVLIFQSPFWLRSPAELSI